MSSVYAPLRQRAADLVWEDAAGRPVPDALLARYIVLGTPFTLADYRAVQAAAKRQGRRVHYPAPHEIQLLSSPDAPPNAALNAAPTAAAAGGPDTQSFGAGAGASALQQIQQQKERLREREIQRQLQIEQERQQQLRTQQQIRDLERAEKVEKVRLQTQEFNGSLCGSAAGSAICLLEIVNRYPDLVLCSPLAPSSASEGEAGGASGLPALCPALPPEWARRFRAFIVDRRDPTLLVASVDYEGLVEQYAVPVRVPLPVQAATALPLVKPVTPQDQRSLWTRVSAAPLRETDALEDLPPATYASLARTTTPTQTTTAPPPPSSSFSSFSSSSPSLSSSFPSAPATSVLYTGSTPDAPPEFFPVQVAPSAAASAFRNSSSLGSASAAPPAPLTELDLSDAELESPLSTPRAEDWGASASRAGSVSGPGTAGSVGRAGPSAGSVSSGRASAPRSAGSGSAGFGAGFASAGDNSALWNSEQAYGASGTTGATGEGASATDALRDDVLSRYALSGSAAPPSASVTGGREPVSGRRGKGSSRRVADPSLWY